MTAKRDAGLPAVVSAVYRHRYALENQYIPPWIRLIHLEGYHEPGDGGALNYTRVNAQPQGHDGWVRSRDGAYWEAIIDDPDPRMFGAKCDLRTVTDAAITAPLGILTSATANFTDADISKRVLVKAAGTNSAGLRTTIIGVTNSTTAILEDVAGATVSGAKCFIASDDTEAFYNAWAYADLKDRRVSLGPKTYYLGTPEDYVSLDAFLLSSDGICGIIGTSSEFSEILWDDNRIGGVAQSLQFFAGTGEFDTDPRIEEAVFSDFKFTGTFDMHGASTDLALHITTSIVFSPKSVNKLNFHNIRFENIRHAAINSRYCEDVRIDRVDIFRGARDGFFINPTPRYHISNCNIWFVDDDAICVGGAASTTEGVPVATGGIIENVMIFASPGIKLAGEQTVTINNVVARFPLRHGLRIQDQNGGPFGTQSRPTPYAINVSNFQIINCLNATELGHPDLEGGTAINIVGSDAKAGDADAIPGEPDPATGIFVDPRLNLMVNPLDDNTSAKAGPNGITLSNVRVFRSANPTANFSDYGYGKMSNRTAFEFDPEVTAAALSVNGILISGVRVSDVHISDSEISGIANGVYFSPDDPDDDVLKFSNIEISDTKFRDLDNPAINGNGSCRLGNFDLVISDCRFTMDPYHRHAGRIANGTGGTTGGWAARDSLVAIGDLAQGTSTDQGIVFKNNIFEECSSVMDAAFDATGNYLALGNIVRMFISATGNSDNNLGVRDGFHPTPAWLVQHAQFDPNVAGYGRTLNDCPITMTSMPSSGNWLPGQFVWKAGPTVSGSSSVIGWIRLTDPNAGGTNHVLGTDWYAVTVNSLATPATTAASNTFTGNQTVTGRVEATSGYRSGIFNVNDDAVATFAVNSPGRIVFVVNDPAHCGTARWQTTNAIAVVEGLSGITVAATGTDLTGTTGTDGNITISINGGEFHFENRSGGNLTSIRYTLFT